VATDAPTTAEVSNPVWRVGPIQRACYALVTAGWLALGVGECIVAGWDGLAVLGFAPIVVWYLWLYALKPSVELTNEAVVIRNPFRRTSIPYAQIKEVDVSEDGYLPLWIQLRSGKSVAAWAIQPTAPFGRRRARRAHEVADAIHVRLPQ
jgi:hypothetical protein